MSLTKPAIVEFTPAVPAVPAQAYSRVCPTVNPVIPPAVPSGAVSSYMVAAYSGYGAGRIVTGLDLCLVYADGSTVCSPVTGSTGFG